MSESALKRNKLVVSARIILVRVRISYCKSLARGDLDSQNMVWPLGKFIKAYCKILTTV